VNFRLLGDCLHWFCLLKITKVDQFWLILSRKGYVIIWTKEGWATFLAMFSQTHLVTLAVGTQDKNLFGYHFA
jgi:hypothetical protein